MMPLPLADTLLLDPGYMAFLAEAHRHHHARVRRVAEAALATIDDDIAAGVDVLAPESALERRLEAVRAVRREGARRYFSFSTRVPAQLANRATSDEAADQDQNSKAADDRLRNSHPQKSKSVPGSNSKNIKTTTTTNPEDPQNSKCSANTPALIYPRRFTANQCAVAEHYLASVPPEQRQRQLDELEGRFRCEQQ